MKQKLFFLLVFFIPSILFAQGDRKGWYGSAGIGYGTYAVYVYNYNRGNGGLYADQKLSNMLVWLGAEKKSVWHVNDFVFDVGGELTAGFGVKNKSVRLGIPLGEDIKGGWNLGIHALFKAGYLVGNEKGKIVPLLGAGPYYTYIKNGSGDEASGNQIYGVQGYAGVDFQLGKFVLTPQMHFGLASWGWSDIWMGADSDNNVQNGQPSMLEAGAKIAFKF